MAVGNRHLGYKEALNEIEASSPGSKASFYFGFLQRAAPLLQPAFDESAGELGVCGVCGAPSSGDVCAFCRLVERAAGPSSAERPGP